MRKRIVIISIATALAAGAGVAATAGHDTDPAAERQAEARYTAAHQDEAAVTSAQAEQVALERHDGTAFDTHLQDEGSLTWEVKVDDGSHVWEINVDAQSGRVVSDQGDD